MYLVFIVALHLWVFNQRCFFHATVEYGNYKINTPDYTVNGWLVMIWFRRDKVLNVQHDIQKAISSNLSKFEKVCPSSPHYLLEREDVWIKRFATKIPFGLNKKD